MHLINCTLEQHGKSILAILNDAIGTSTALYDYTPRPPESMIGWFKSKQAADYPVIGAVDDRGTLLGFTSYAAFRAWPAYKYSIEHSVYVHQSQRGKGIGFALLQRLIQLATQQEYHTLIGGIDATNIASIALHVKLGFKCSGTMRQVGFKFGNWLDLSFYQLILNTPFAPVDG